MFLYCSLRTVVTAIETTVQQANSSRLIVQSAISLFSHLPISMRQKLDLQPGVAAVTHWTWFGGIFIDEQNFFARFAVDVPTLRRAYGDRGPVDIWMPPEQWEAFEKEKTACIVGRGLLSRFQDAGGNPLLALGNTAPLKGNIFPGDYRFTVRGVYESRNPAFDEQTLFFHWDYLDEVCERKGEVSLFVLLLRDPSMAPEVARSVDEEFRGSAFRTRTLT
jgi:putative ABC transport system permease protein